VFPYSMQRCTGAGLQEFPQQETNRFLLIPNSISGMQCECDFREQKHRQMENWDPVSETALIFK
jgi:hypothetical protein